MTLRRRASGSFELPITAAAAVEFFTPEGERSWTPGWDPTYPAGDVSENPGTVFVSRHGVTETIWIIQRIDRAVHTLVYARITPGHHAGTVRVRCEEEPDDTCVVTVEYDMTSLNPSHPQALDPYDEESFGTMMSEWATRVAAVLTP